MSRRTQRRVREGSTATHTTTAVSRGDIDLLLTVSRGTEVEDGEREGDEDILVELWSCEGSEERE